jgi:hypothetical protein
MASSQSGLEARYLSRFAKIPAQTGKSLKNYDATGNVAEHLTQAKSSLKTQEKNINGLFATAQELIIGIDTAQQLAGEQFVKNIPLPTADIRESLGKQLGYIQLTMRFLHAGVIHFMEQNLEAYGRIRHLEDLLEKMAAYDEEIDLIGEMQTMDLDQLEAMAKQATVKKTEADIAIETIRGNDVTNPLSPPHTPTKDQNQMQKPQVSRQMPKNAKNPK